MLRKPRLETLLAETERLPAKIITKAPPREGASLLRAARLLMLSQRYDDAVYLYELRLNNIPSDPIALAELSLVCAQSGQSGRASDLQRQLLACLPDEVGHDLKALIRLTRNAENETGPAADHGPVGLWAEVFVFTNATANSLMQNASIHGVMDCIEDKQGDTDARPG